MFRIYKDRDFESILLHTEIHKKKGNDKENLTYFYTNFVICTKDNKNK